MGVLSFMTYMTIRFFILNNIELPEFLRTSSLVMYGLCGVTVLTQLICNRYYRSMVRALIFIPIYVTQMVFQVYMLIKFQSSGYMIAFQWISVLSIFFAFPLFTLLVIIGTFGGEFVAEKFLYVIIYPFVFQIYLHIGYVCFFLYCDEGYLSSVLLLSGSFALGNVIHSAFYLIFPRKIWEAVPVKDDSYNSTHDHTNYTYRAKALYDCMYV